MNNIFNLLNQLMNLKAKQHNQVKQAQIRCSFEMQSYLYPYSSGFIQLIIGIIYKFSPTFGHVYFCTFIFEIYVFAKYSKITHLLTLDIQKRFDNLDLIKNQIYRMIGINGFGRIGRLILRAAIQNNKGLTVTAINDPMMDVRTLRYLLQYDSAHLKFQHTVQTWQHGIQVNGQKIRLYTETDPSKIPWGENGVATVMECTGKFLTTEGAKKHLTNGPKKIIISAPPKDDTPLFVYGVNHNDYKADCHVISNASCTTNCLAPIAKVLHDNFTITEGLMTTIHAATASQAVVDQAVKPGQSFRGGRATGNNIVPYSTGAAKALGKVITSLKGKVTGMSFRVPPINVSVVDFTFKTEKACTYDDICHAMQKEANGSMKGVLGYTEDEIVSSDVLHDPRSSVFDSKAGLSLNSNFHKVVSWYDNEWGYSNRMLDLAKHVHKVSGI